MIIKQFHSGSGRHIITIITEMVMIFIIIITRIIMMIIKELRYGCGEKLLRASSFVTTLTAGIESELLVIIIIVVVIVVIMVIRFPFGC